MHHQRENLASSSPKRPPRIDLAIRRPCHAGHRVRWRTDVKRPFPGIAVNRLRAAASGMNRAAKWLATFCAIASSVGCVLTQDIPDPALDLPNAYKHAGKANPDNLPTLDWWRGFGSPEMTTLMEEAQRVNLDVAAAVARFMQADALARQAGAALLPSLQGNGQEAYSRTSGSSASGLSIGGREVVNYSASLSASYQLDFWGQNRDALQAAEETATADRFDRDVTALAVLVSRPPESLHVTGGSLPQLSSPRVTPGLPSELLTQRPDIRRQEAQLASSTANIGNARAQFFPSIQLTGQGGYQSSALVSLFQPHAAFFSLVGGLTQPIFDGGKILGNFEFTNPRPDELT